MYLLDVYKDLIKKLPYKIFRFSHGLLKTFFFFLCSTSCSIKLVTPSHVQHGSDSSYYKL